MSNKRQAEDNYQNQDRRRGDGSDDKRPRRQKKHKHLYVALDDWNKGFSIYKIDADDIFNDDDQEDLPSPRGRIRLDPPVLQLESPAGDMRAVAFSALGTKIFALMNQSCGLIYDTETAVLAMGPHAPAQMVCGSSTYIRVGEMLYALSSHASENKYSFFAMSWGPITDSVTPKEGWSWKSLPSPPPEFNRRVAAYALHPDGCTIFITTSHDARMCTYSFDTKRSVWTWLGYWALPFLGQGHFDTELDAWVGLRFDGSVCTCQVLSPTTIPAPANHHHQQELDCKMTQEKLAEDRIFSSRCISASLIHIGCSKFCIVQSLARELEQGHPHPLTDHDGCVLQITTFGLKYNGKGELRTTSKQHFTRSFLVSRHRIYQFIPTAFWM